MNIKTFTFNHTRLIATATMKRFDVAQSWSTSKHDHLAHLSILFLCVPLFRPKLKKAPQELHA